MNGKNEAIRRLVEIGLKYESEVMIGADEDLKLIRQMVAGGGRKYTAGNIDRSRYDRLVDLGWLIPFKTNISDVEYQVTDEGQPQLFLMLVELAEGEDKVTDAFSAMEYAHWLIVAGSVLLVLGFIGLALRRRSAPLEPTAVSNEQRRAEFDAEITQANRKAKLAAQTKGRWANKPKPTGDSDGVARARIKPPRKN